MNLADGTHTVLYVYGLFDMVWIYCILVISMVKTIAEGDYLTADSRYCDVSGDIGTFLIVNV